MKYQENTIKSEIKFEGNIITLRVDTVELHNGKTATREVIEHPGGVAILPVDSDGSVYLVRQFRKPIEQSLLEAPAGKLSRGEAHYDCGVRELKEETGLSADKITYLGYIIPTPGYTDELIHLYLAQGLSHGAQSTDEDEFVDVEKFSFDDVHNMCLSGKISDAKTVAAVFRSKPVI